MKEKRKITLLCNPVQALLWGVKTSAWFLCFVFFMGPLFYRKHIRNILCNKLCNSSFNMASYITAGNSSWQSFRKGSALAPLLFCLVKKHQRTYPQCGNQPQAVWGPPASYIINVNREEGWILDIPKRADWAPSAAHR